MNTTATGPLISNRKAVKSVIWLTILLLVGSSAYNVAKKADAARAPKPIPTYTLGCGTDKDIQLPNVAEVLVIVQPQPPQPPANEKSAEETGDEEEEAGCWTDWVLRPQEGTPRFWAEPDSEIDVQQTFGDGTTTDPFVDGPRLRIRESEEITAMSFRNLGDKAVTIPIKLR
jgi:hypothetical protein